jgi:D-alanine transaminase
VLCYLNGEFVPRASARISVEDRGFIFGDGVYEVWRAIDGGLFEPERHLARLQHGLRELRIAPPDMATMQGVRAIADRLLAESGLTAGHASVYLEITRGAAPRAHTFPATPVPPTVFMMVNRVVPADELRARGAAAITMPDVRWLRCDIKTVQLLPNVLARQAAADRGATEALLVRDDVLTEGSHTNVFAVVGGALRTHPLTHLVLPGITRAVVLELAASAGIPVDETPIRAADIARVDELFLVGTTTDVMPIVRVDGTTIGGGTPGPITMRLSDALRAYMDERCRTRTDVAAAADAR